MVDQGENSIKWKLVASIGIAAILIFSLVTGFTVVETSAEVTSLTEQRMDQTAQANANFLNADMQEYNQTAVSLGATMEAYKKADASRQEVSEILKNIAIKNPDALGVYVAYEPDAFDGNDAAHLNETGPGSNDAGRFAPYWSRFGGNLSRSPLNDLDSQDWYARPLEEGHPVIKGPFMWGGEYMISFLTPIKRNGEAIGVAGVDVSISYWQNQTQQADIPSDGYAFVASNDGMLVAYPNTSAVGQTTLDELGKRNNVSQFRTMQDQIKSRDAGNFSMTDPVTRQEALVRYQSIETGDFVYAAVVPKDTALAGVTSMRNGLIGASAVGLLLLVGIIFIGARRITRPIDKLTQRASAIEGGDYEVDLETDRGDEIGVLYDSLSSMRDSLVTNINKATEAQNRAEQAQRDAEQLNTHLTEKAEAFSKTMNRAADGDLTQRMEPESQSAAMTDIAEAFNAMVTDLEATVAQIHSFADEVAESGEEVTAGTEESQNASEQVSESIQAISADADTQSESLQNVANEMQNFSGTVEEMASSVDEIATTSQETADLGRRGQEAATDAMAEMEAIEEKSDTTVENIESLATEIDEVSEINELITNIAGQTNMLALNASVEAARAGEAGEGFAVVADEIKGLAEEVSEATEEVESLISNIQSSTDTAVDDIQDMRDRVSSGTTTIEDALDALRAIAENVEASNQSIQEISTVTDDQAASTEEVASTINEVANTAEQINSESENVSAAAQEQTASLTQVAQNTQTLAERADELKSLLSQFTIQEEPIRPTAHESEPSQTAVSDGGSTDQNANE